MGGEVIPGDPHSLGLTVLLCIGYQFTFFVVTVLFNTQKVTDLAGGTNFVILALVTLLLGDYFHLRQILVTAFVMVWGIRLSGFLLFRIIKWDRDNRLSHKLIRIIIFWILQLLWVWLVSLPTTYLNTSSANPDFAWNDYLGIALCVFGFFFESIADHQKLMFKLNPEKKDMYCSVGVWQFSRHPNYFGELCFWWGNFAICSSILSSDEWVAVLGPIFITFLLLFLSGIPLIEKGHTKKFGSNPLFAQYRKQTSCIIPFPPSVYVNLPVALKSTLFLDFPFYRAPIPPETGSLVDNEVKGAKKVEEHA
eukprot:Nk52_evm52s230 gene=Nk52_evmTU52s230